MNEIFYVLKSKLKALYDAIRAKAGLTASLTIDAAIEAVSGLDTTGPDALVDRSITSYTAGDGVTSIGAAAFQTCKALVAVVGNNIETISFNAFRDIFTAGVAKTVAFSFPELVSVSSSAFDQAAGTVGDSSATFNAPKLQNIQANAFRRFPVTELTFPELTTIRSGAFSGCPLTSLTLPGETVPTLESADAFAGTPIAAGTGVIRVPATLVDTYKSATNWSTYSTQITAIEEG